jgi:prepilin peptidase CpaA
MNTHSTIWMCAILLTATAAVVDFRTRKIPNWLTVPAMIAGITLRSTTGGWPGTKASLEGLGLALVLLLPLVLLRALGAGDWKLMGAVGGILGPVLFLFVLFGSILCSGVMAMIQMVRTKRVRETFRNMMVLVKGFVSFGIRKNPQISLDNPELMKLPFGVAVAVSTLACFCAACLGL